MMKGTAARKMPPARNTVCQPLKSTTAMVTKPAGGARREADETAGRQADDQGNAGAVAEYSAISAMATGHRPLPI